MSGAIKEPAAPLRGRYQRGRPRRHSRVAASVRPIVLNSVVDGKVVDCVGSFVGGDAQHIAPAKR